ncbi:ThiF family adenylyltransferase [Zavarzinella formosa]|uniref:ThiF family adenylyltransferase n=1 Tax=Zavarzinella formosa TaxID=360055 RepID=UPI00035FF463|nr:ThiF family adenylyltransferase [Zavarzinella formosa]
MRQNLRIAGPLFDRLAGHLFPGDHDEHGAVVLAGVQDSPSGTRFLARDVILARDGTDYVPGTRGYRALTTDFIADVTDRCARENLCYFAAHCHEGRDEVAFSSDDYASHRRGYPALLDITNGGPVGALVFAGNAAAGSVWRPGNVSPLDSVTVVGSNIRHLYARPPAPPAPPASAPPEYHRQSLLFGARGQHALAGCKVGIIGLGGVGSLISQWLAHLGIGHIVGIDFDVLDPSNRPRVVGSTPSDAGEPLIRSGFAPLRWLGQRLVRHKVNVARRVARQTNPSVRYDAVVGNVNDLHTARLLVDADYVFLCADTMQARLVFTALVHQYLIPGIQIGSKVPVEKRTGHVLDPFLVARRVLPYAGGGCLLCNQLIPADRLREESLSPAERLAEGYITDPAVTAPSVITMNALAASQAANDFLYGFLGLHFQDAFEGYFMHHPRQRVWETVDCASDPNCRFCGLGLASAYARGDRVALPCRIDLQ